MRREDEASWTWTRVETVGTEPVVAPSGPGFDCVEIVGFERDADCVEFFLVRVRLLSIQYVLKRRYSQFEALARSMRVAGRRHALPSKYVRHTDENLNHRGEALERWIRAVAADEACASDVEHYLWPFLELDSARALMAQLLLEEQANAIASENSSEGVLSEAEAERVRLRAELGNKANEVKRLEHGMSTAKALVATLRQKLIEAERACKQQAGAAAAQGRAVQAAAGSAEPPTQLPQPEQTSEPQPAGLQDNELIATQSAPCASPGAAADETVPTEPAQPQPESAPAPAAPPATAQPQPKAQATQGKAAKRKASKQGKGNGCLPASAQRPIATH